MNPLRKLAGQTAIYGVSSIIGRLLNYLLVPLYTRVFIPEQYGTVVEMYSYVAFLAVILTYGMETAFFRYHESDHNKQTVFSTTFLSLLFSSIFFFVVVSIFSPTIATWIRYPEHKEYIIWFAAILALDAISTIPFAKLRALNKAKRFATVRLLNIGLNIGLNLFFLILCPYLIKHSESSWLLNIISIVYDPSYGIAYVFISNLIASALTIVLLLPEIVEVKFSFDYSLWRKMFIYAFPLLFAGLAGIVNETMDRVFLKYLLPPDIAMTQVGIYGACYKVAILITIFVQAFRYAAEPFFFSHAERKDAKEIYANVMKYFVICMCIIFLATMLYIDVVIKFVGPAFRIGAPVIPILLLANIFLGIFYNLSIWYKLTNKTILGAYMALFGAVITIALNIYWIPRIGYMGSAWATFICYGSMMALSYFVGQKYYPINYQVLRIVGYVAFTVFLYLVSKWLSIEFAAIKWVVHSFLFILFIATAYFVEKPKLHSNASIE